MSDERDDCDNCGGGDWRGGAGHDHKDWWQSEPLTAERTVSLDAAGQILDGVLTDARSGAVSASSSYDDGGGAGPCVLVVDDSVELREIYSQALRRFGSFGVVTASDGSEGLAKARALQPAAIVTDFSMPVMTGGELARSLAADERTRRIPVVMVSAFADEVPRGQRLSCAAFMAKPCGPKELADVVKLAITAGAEMASRASSGR